MQDCAAIGNRGRPEEHELSGDLSSLDEDEDMFSVERGNCSIDDIGDIEGLSMSMEMSDSGSGNFN